MTKQQIVFRFGLLLFLAVAFPGAGKPRRSVGQGAEKAFLGAMPSNSAAREARARSVVGARYFVRVFNCDDGCRAEIGDVATTNTSDRGVLTRTQFGQDSGWIDFTDTLQPGQNRITMLVFNIKRVIAYGFQIKKDEKLIFEKICGRAGTVGCENNRVFNPPGPSGAIKEFTYDISISPAEVPTSYQRWLSFYEALRVAANQRNGVALRRLISAHYDGAGGNPDGVIREINRRNGWRALQKSLASGTRNSGLGTDNQGRPERWTKDGQYWFQYGVDGQWRWCGENVGD